jgi:hypothetical protein
MSEAGFRAAPRLLKFSNSERRWREREVVASEGLTLSPIAKMLPV